MSRWPELQAGLFYGLFVLPHRWRKKTAFRYGLLNFELRAASFQHEVKQAVHIVIILKGQLSGICNESRNDYVRKEEG